MKDNDNQFISEVVDFYYSTIDPAHPQGNMSLVADKFQITRAKVNKILITAAVIDSPLHQDIMKLKERGYDTDDIASALGVSATTVKINMPYEKVIYNGEAKSPGAEYVEAFRKRQQVFLSNVVRRKTALELEREAYYNSPLDLYFQDFVKEYDLYSAADTYQGGPEYPDSADTDLGGLEFPDDPVHLIPDFSDEESKLFKIRPDLMVLHIELDADLSDVKDLAGIRFPSLLHPAAESASVDLSSASSPDTSAPYTISRDILVPDQMPLHNLHYVLNQAFGFTNSHLHAYTLNNHDLAWFTEGKVSKWKKYLGLVFKNPLRDEDMDFWDDDYAGGSPKKWMRRKYTGPVYEKLFEESYRYTREQAEGMKVKAKKLENLEREFDLDPFALNEALPVSEILSEYGQDEYESIKEYNRYMRESFDDAVQYPPESPMAQPFVYAFAETLNYCYDFGDDWKFTIKAMDDLEYLMKDGRITADQIKEAIKDVCTLARPLVIAADGLPLVEDVGGVYGYKDFLRGINGQESEMYSNKQESLTWAKSNGWPGKIGNLKTIL